MQVSDAAIEDIRIAEASSQTPAEAANFTPLERCGLAYWLTSAKLARMTGRLHRIVRRTIGFALLGIFAACVPTAFGRDVFVMLSGGNSPFDNNYSQYLQARAVTDFFQKHYPSNSVWVFFGAGNVQGEKPALADVCQETVRDGIAIPSWLPGALPHNLPARRAVFLSALHNEILPAIADGGTLFLFVGDHGSRTRGRNPQSEIDLWSLSRDPGSEHGWREDQDETLSVSDLRSALTNGVGKGRVVFCMTQCHAGGFHYLGIPHEMVPNPKWFTDVPEYAFPKTQPVFPNVAGFTATDEFSMASGCDPDPDPARWAGYERFVPENLLGINLFTLNSTGKCLRSFAEAHIAATLEDETIDKPASTSEQFLERWANLIETHLATEPNLTPKVRAAVTTYRRAVDGYAVNMSDADFKQRQARVPPLHRKTLRNERRTQDAAFHRQPHSARSGNQIRSRGDFNCRPAARWQPPRQPAPARARPFRRTAAALARNDSSRVESSH